VLTGMGAGGNEAQSEPGELLGETSDISTSITSTHVDNFICLGAGLWSVSRAISNLRFMVIE